MEKYITKHKRTQNQLITSHLLGWLLLKNKTVAGTVAQQIESSLGTPSAHTRVPGSSPSYSMFLMQPPANAYGRQQTIIQVPESQASM